MGIYYLSMCMKYPILYKNVSFFVSKAFMVSKALRQNKPSPTRLDILAIAFL